MGRKKIDMAPIASNNKRMMMFRKRKNAIMKKARELSILCDVQVCVIIYGDKGEPPYVWPEEPEKLNNILARYMNTSIEERQKRALNLSAMQERSQKEQGLGMIKDNQFENLPKNVFTWDERLNIFTSEQLMGLSNHLDSKIKFIEHKIDAIKRSQSLPNLENTLTQYHGGDDEQQKMMKMKLMVMRDMQLQQLQQLHQYHEEERMNAEANAMKILNNGGGFCNLLNNNNNNIVNMGDYNGYIARHVIHNGPFVNPSPLQCYAPNDQLQVQAHQFNVGRQP